MSVIEIKNLTKDYGNNRGVFDISFHVNKGECYGFLGPNGAGKTTTIRHLMGFSKPQKGSACINGFDCWNEANEIKHRIGYLPGEIAFPKGMSGIEFLKMQMKMRDVDDDSYMKHLLKTFDLDPNINIDEMSLGVKRKLAVVTAFIHDPDILILDEPTSGLDPIMQQQFINFILLEKQKGKTILLSSHIFKEVDATCDRISIIKDGKIVTEIVASDLKNRNSKIYRITFNDEKSYLKFTNMNYKFSSKNKLKLRARVILNTSDINDLIQDISDLNVYDLQEIPFTLEDYFMSFYKNNKQFEGVK